MVFERGFPLAIFLRVDLCRARAGAGCHSAAPEALAPFPPGYATKKAPACCRASATPGNRVSRLSSIAGKCLRWCLLGCLCLARARGVQAACGEALADTHRAVAAEAQALRVTEQILRAAQTEVLNREAALHETLAHPPADYSPMLAQRLAVLRRTEVEIKLRMLEWLRTQHEESRRHWERDHQLLYPQLVDARAAFQARTLSVDDYCGMLERYRQALQLYRQGMLRYRVGMDLYAQALVAYGAHFLLFYIQGFTHQQTWEVLIQRLERGDFLQDVLVPLMVNAIRSPPPAAPPARKQAFAAESGR